MKFWTYKISENREDGNSVACEKQADDFGESFPNFMNLTEEERDEFFQTLHIARMKLEKNGVNVRSRFGTVHDRTCDNSDGWGIGERTKTYTKISISTDGFNPLTPNEFSGGSFIINELEKHFKNEENSTEIFPHEVLDSTLSLNTSFEKSISQATDIGLKALAEVCRNSSLKISDNNLISSLSYEILKPFDGSGKTLDCQKKDEDLLSSKGMSLKMLITLASTDNERIKACGKTEEVQTEYPVPITEGDSGKTETVFDDAKPDAGQCAEEKIDDPEIEDLLKVDQGSDESLQDDEEDLPTEPQRKKFRKRFYERKKSAGKGKIEIKKKKSKEGNSNRKCERERLTVGSRNGHLEDEPQVGNEEEEFEEFTESDVILRSKRDVSDEDNMLETCGSESSYTPESEATVVLNKVPAGQSSVMLEKTPQCKCGILLEKVPESKATVSPREMPEGNSAVLLKQVPQNKCDILLEKVPESKPIVSPRKLPEGNSAVLIEQVPRCKCDILLEKVPESKPTVLHRKVPADCSSVMLEQMPQCKCDILLEKVPQSKSTELHRKVSQGKSAVLLEKMPQCKCGVLLEKVPQNKPTVLHRKVLQGKSCMVHERVPEHKASTLYKKIPKCKLRILNRKPCEEDEIVTQQAVGNIKGGELPRVTSVLNEEQINSNSGSPRRIRSPKKCLRRKEFSSEKRPPRAEVKKLRDCSPYVKGRSARENISEEDLEEILLNLKRVNREVQTGSSTPAGRSLKRREMISQTEPLPNFYPTEYSDSEAGESSRRKKKRVKFAESVKDPFEDEQNFVPPFKHGKVIFVDNRVIEKIKNVVLDLERKTKSENIDAENEYLVLLMEHVEYLSAVMENLITSQVGRPSVKFHIQQHLDGSASTSEKDCYSDEKTVAKKCERNKFLSFMGKCFRCGKKEV